MKMVDGTMVLDTVEEVDAVTALLTKIGEDEHLGAGLTVEQSQVCCRLGGDLVEAGNALGLLGRIFRLSKCSLVEFSRLFRG